MSEIEQLFPFLDRFIQWIVIPMAAFLWSHSKKHVEHEKKFIQTQGEIAAVLAALEVWKTQRSEDQRQRDAAIDKLTKAVEKLNDRLDKIVEGNNHHGG